jgi:hypothetical protein
MPQRESAFNFGLRRISCHSQTGHFGPPGSTPWGFLHPSLQAVTGALIFASKI